jgi:homoprotocatechuate degradation regulator HpaR
MAPTNRKLPPYRQSLAGTLLAAREAVMAPIRPHLREAGVTEQQWRVLRVLDGAEDTDPTTLAHAALLFAPSVSRIVKDLVERGLVIRRDDPADGRRSILSLSETGRALIREAAGHTMRVLDEYEDRFGRERLARLIDELRELTAAISAGREDG